MCDCTRWGLWICMSYESLSIRAHDCFPSPGERDCNLTDVTCLRSLRFESSTLTFADLLTMQYADWFLGTWQETRETIAYPCLCLCINNHTMPKYTSSNCARAKEACHVWAWYTLPKLDQFLVHEFSVFNFSLSEKFSLSLSATC